MAGRDEEVWRVANVAKGRDTRLGTGSGSHRSPPLSAAAKARLGRIARRAPEVMVKVTGRSRGIAGFKAHLDYVTRNGRLLAETQDGTKIQDREGIRRLHDDWLLENAVNARGRSTPQAAQSVGIILSMPPGAPRDRVQDAARTWARETFADRHEWLMVRHDDKDHPHVHVTVRAVGIDGKRLAPGPADLQQWRERFARELRRLGVEAEATPRQARGKVRRPDPTPVHQIERRGAKPTIRNLQHDDAARAAKGPRLPKPRDWQRDIQHRQESIRAAYLEHAASLAEGTAEDKRLANDVRRFVAEMPVALTRRQRLATELRQVLEQRKSADTPARSSGLTVAIEPVRPMLEPGRTPAEPTRDEPTRRR